MANVMIPMFKLGVEIYLGKPKIEHNDGISADADVLGLFL